ncbi:hypothetical protein ACLB2K_001614 [Fragaria x ananassa]
MAALFSVSPPNVLRLRAGPSPSSARICSVQLLKAPTVEIFDGSTGLHLHAPWSPVKLKEQPIKADEDAEPDSFDGASELEFQTSPMYFIALKLGSTMSSSYGTQKKDFGWQWTKPIPGIRPCPKVPPNVKNLCSQALQRNDNQKKEKVVVLREIGGLESLEEEDALDHEVTNMTTTLASDCGSAQTIVVGSSQSPLGGGGSMGQPKARGLMDNYVSLKTRQTTLNTSYKKQERRNVCRAIGRLFYTSGLAFNVANNLYYFAALEMVSNYGPGFKRPTSHELRTWILKDEVEDVQKLMVDHKKDWSKYGCTIMSDGWTDGKSRVTLKFLVNSPKGKRKALRKSIILDDIVDDDTRSNRFDDTNPLFQHGDDDDEGGDDDDDDGGDGGDNDGDDSLDGDILIDDNDNFEA